MTYKEMIGKQFGSLRVIRKASNKGELQGGRGHKSISPGDRFGKLVAIEYETKQTISGKSIPYINCGNIVSIRKDHLTRGHGENGPTISCTRIGW